MYHLFEEPLSSEVLDEWVNLAGEFSLVKGYTDFGDLFLINPKSNEVAILFTMENTIEPMGFTDWQRFVDRVLLNPGFQEDVMDFAFRDKVRTHCGELGEEEVYIATPYPFIGGSGAPDTYKKGNVWVYLAISSQTWAQI